LGFEVHGAAGHRAEAIGVEQRRRAHHVPDALSGPPHVLERDGKAGHRRPPHLQYTPGRAGARPRLPTAKPATAVAWHTTGTAVPDGVMITPRPDRPIV